VPAELDAVTLVASDYGARLEYYDAALGALGLERVAEFGDEEEDDPAVEAAGWSTPSGRAVLWLVEGAAPSHGVHVTIRADARADVERFFAAACAAGGQPRARPRRWAIYRRGDFAAAVTDPDGNTIEVVAPE